MSNINVKRAVENIRSGTSVYTPLVETVVNAIQAIESGAAEPLELFRRVITVSLQTIKLLRGFPRLEVYQ